MKTAMDMLGIVLVVLLPPLLMLGVMAWQSLRTRLNARNPLTVVEAAMIGRSMKEGRRNYFSHTSTPNEYTVTFRPADGGEDLTFDVSATEYRAWRSGDRGTLTYRTWELVSFRPENREAVSGDVPVAFNGEE